MYYDAELAVDSRWRFRLLSPGTRRRIIVGVLDAKNLGMDDDGARRAARRRCKSWELMLLGLLINLLIEFVLTWWKNRAEEDMVY